MNAVVTDLERVRDAVTQMALARIDDTGRADTRWVPLLESIDAMIVRWESGATNPDGLYQLGMLVGSVAGMTSCRVTVDGALEPLPVDYPDHPVANAVVGIRNAVLTFTAPA